MPDGTQRVVASARDDAALLALSITVELSPQGVLRTRAQLTDLATGRGLTEMPYTLDGLTLSLPVPRRAAELLDFAGRHLRERHRNAGRSTSAPGSGTTGAAAPARMPPRWW